MIKFKGLIAPTEVPTGDGRMFATGKMTHRPMPIPLMARFGSGSHDGATPVGKITSIYPGPGGYWAEGEFLNPAIVPEVPKAVYMLQERVMGPSVDLDRDYTVKAVPHPVRPDKKAGLFEEYNVIGTTLVPMPAFYQVHMSVETQEEQAILASAGVDVSRLHFNSLEDVDMEREITFATSIAMEDEAECGCDGSDLTDLSQEIVPEIGVGTVTTMSGASGTTFTVSGAVPPSSVTVTFGNPSSFNLMAGYGPNAMQNEETPVAVVKVLEDKTVIKVPHVTEEKESCYFDDNGHCPVCGY